jgi:uncharacterized membrane protein YeaQ/YmgE (transglycosylase-associated protein family)
MMDDIFAWIAIGAAASLAGMIWPFRRGAAGIGANLAAGSVGAVALGLASSLFWRSPDQGHVRLLFAALGALVALLLAHGLWNRRVRQAHHPKDTPAASSR